MKSIKNFLKMFYSSILLTGLLMGFMPTYGANENQDMVSRYQLKEYTDNSKSLKQMQYRLYLPDEYDESIAYPLVVFFGGAGQNVAGQIDESEESNKYIDSSLLANGNDRKYPCIILVPLLPVDYFWVDNYYGEISPGLDLTMSMIDSVCQDYSVDQRKIYITGLCFGANGTWDILFRFPHKFAAGVPVSGVAPSSMASKIPNVPIWLFCSDTDPNAPVDQSRAMVEALKEAGNKEVRYTEFSNYSHIETTVAAFWNNDLFPWMFSQTNLNAPFPEGKIPVEIAAEDLVMENPDSGQIAYVSENNKDNDSIAQIQDPTNPLKKSSLRIVIILVVVMICLGGVFLLFYKKILFGSARTRQKENDGNLLKFNKKRKTKK